MGPGKKGKDLDLDQQVDFLKKISFFHGFDDHELKQFLQVSKWLRVPQDTMIIKENTTERAFYILVKGEVRVEKQLAGGGKPISLTTLSTGDCFGEMALVTEIKRTADVIANKESFILRVEPDIVSTSNVFLQLKFYKRFCESLVTRLDLANKRVVGSKGSEEASPSILQKVLADGGAQEPAARIALVTSPQPKVKPLKPKPERPEKEKLEIVLPPMPDKEQRLTPSKLYPKVHPESILPVNPAVAAELGRLLQGGAETENTRRFADLISMDPVLSCRVIQTANSPFFRRASMVGTVPHAMVIVGVKQIQEVVINTIRAAKGSPAFSGFTGVARDFWQHAVVVGRIAEMLKDVIRINTAADLYLCGLLHDLGMLVLDSISPNFYPQLARPPVEMKDVVKAEKEYIGIDHGQAGVWLAEGIGLPQPYLDVMKFHHLPEKAATNPVPVALVNLANIFASLKGVCMGHPEVTEQDALRSFSWVLIQEQHKPFLDVNVNQFISSFLDELDKTWPSLTGDILL
ncbi:HDOD domain-containing protein [Thiovibrio sp. JS02]